MSQLFLDKVQGIQTVSHWQYLMVFFTSCVAFDTHKITPCSFFSPDLTMMNTDIFPKTEKSSGWKRHKSASYSLKAIVFKSFYLTNSCFHRLPCLECHFYNSISLLGGLTFHYWWSRRHWQISNRLTWENTRKLQNRWEKLSHEIPDKCAYTNWSIPITG